MIVNYLHRARGESGLLGGEGQLLASGVRGLLFESGSIAGLAALVYLFAPAAVGRSTEAVAMAEARPTPE